MSAIYKWFTQSWLTRVPGGADSHPVEATALRLFALFIVTLFVIVTFTSTPHPGVQGRGALVLIAAVVLVASAIAAKPHRTGTSTRRVIVSLLGVTVASAVLAALQPNGIWTAGPYYVGIMAALRLDRTTGALLMVLALALPLAVSAIGGHDGALISLPLGAIPWFLVMRLMRELRDQRDALAVSRAAEARAAATAERSRLTREMHDVLAHSLSALALQLESTRLLAHDRGVDEEVTQAVDRAHHIAASGLQEARRVIATERGDELPGPERIGALADAFGEQSGLPVDVEVRGEPRQLAPDARLAVYRTAQEALTNVRRHAAAERVEVSLAYLPGSTVLVVQDHAAAGTPPPPPMSLTGDGYGLTGMRERAQLLGGELHAEPTDDGFRVELRLPT
jgi:signal transduction histidine kinase